ncbi:MAG: ABC transporter ATP-binding protein [Gemmatimonadales bacterium]
MSLELHGLRKRFGEVVAVRDLSLELEPGELMTLLGPSGCGKTTALRLIAGFEAPDAGRILFRGTDVTARSPRRRGFGMVFQSYALFPHLSVFENVAFGLKAQRVEASELGRLVEAALARVDLLGYADRRVQELSGGQQQRVALARALAIEPPLLLLDEPLSNLDASLRERTRTELRTLLKGLGITAVYVTHDQEEAFDLSDRVAVMNDGELRQVGTPEELYDHPRDVFVAGFVGRANLLPGRLESPQGGELSVRIAGEALWPIDPTRTGGLEPGQAVQVVVRPEDLEIAPGGSHPSELVGVVSGRMFRGAWIAYRVKLTDGAMVEVEADRRSEARSGQIAVRPRSHARVHVYPSAE